jgi:hypothetical protein
MANYYTLATFQNGKWAPQFGDYSRNTVVEEKNDSYKNTKWEIVKTTDNQEAINEAIAKL